MNEFGENLVKIASDEASTYLEKCAGIADAYMNDALSQEDAVDISNELGVDPRDVDSVIVAAYGDVLEKEASVKEKAASVLGKIKEISANATGASDFKNASKIGKSMESFSEEGKKGAAYKKLTGDRKKALKAGAAKATATTAVVGGTGYGATKLFGKKDKDN